MKGPTKKTFSEAIMQKSGSVVTKNPSVMKHGWLEKPWKNGGINGNITGIYSIRSPVDN